METETGLGALAGRRVGFIGAGAMAEALAGGLVAAGLEPGKLCVSDPDPARCKRLEQSLGASVAADNLELVKSSDVVVLAVKPGVLPQVLEGLADAPGRTQPLWVSIAAGVRIAAIETALGSGARVVRAMPNTPALARCGATAISAGSAAAEDDLACARALFLSVGTCWTAPDEGLLDAVTGLSGSGPAYVFVFIEALADAGVRVGLPREAASELALQTVYGAARLALEDGRPPAALRDQVSSPGGTTLAGLEKLEAGGLRAALQEAVAAATRRSRELAGD